MPARLMIGCRVDSEVKEQIDSLAESSRTTSPKILEIEIALFLGIDTQDGPTSRIDQHLAEIKQLKLEVAELTESIKQL